MATTKQTRSAAEVVGDALATHQAVSVGELAQVTGLGQSTVSKVLATFEKEGTVVRSAGGRDGGRRLPDRWSPSLSGSDEAKEVADDTAAEESTAATAGATKRPSVGRERLGKGVLGDLVLAHLVANPDDEHGPVAVAKALGGKSSGAVGNCLQRLSDAGAVVLTSSSPRRYRYTGGGAATTQGRGESGRAQRPSRPSKGNRRTKAGAR